MVDVFDKKKRSAVMAAIRSRGNRDTELRLIRIFRIGRISGWRRNQVLPGRPDFVFRASRLAIFVDGCFWHGCPQHGRNPTSNIEYWKAKLECNKERDVIVVRVLRRRGWTVMRIWEHNLARPEAVIRKIQKALY
jgi:DNA mismatch endonuclease (patch repair protein)